MPGGALASQSFWWCLWSVSGGCRLEGIVLDHLTSLLKGHPVHANFAVTETKGLGPRKDSKPAQSLPVQHKRARFGYP